MDLDPFVPVSGQYECYMFYNNYAVNVIINNNYIDRVIGLPAA